LYNRGIGQNQDKETTKLGKIGYCIEKDKSLIYHLPEKQIFVLSVSVQKIFSNQLQYYLSNNRLDRGKIMKPISQLHLICIALATMFLSACSTLPEAHHANADGSMYQCKFDKNGNPIAFRIKESAVR